MKTRMCLKALLAIVPVLVFALTSCGDDNGSDFRKGREIFMSENVAFQIIFPSTQDTILYRDTLSGFTTWVQDDSLHLSELSILYDSLNYQGKKHYLSLNMSFSKTYIHEVATGIRELSCSGEAAILFDTLKVDKNKTSLKVSPITGSIENQTIQLFSALLPDETQPYIVMRSTGKRIN